MVLDILLDTVIDCLKLIPFLFIAFFLMELFEHKFSDKTGKILKKSGKFGPVLGGVLGAVPQCGFSVLATNLYVMRIISLGTLVSIYLSTSDEMLPILLSSGVSSSKIISLVVFKVVIGMVCGFLIDLLWHNKKRKGDFHICEEEHCDCEESILKSSVIHTIKTLVFIFLITFLLNSLFEIVSEDVIESLFLKNSVFAAFVSSLIGLIPNCGASIVITEMYLNGVITFGTCIGGLLTGSGIALLVLFRTNKNKSENINILILLYLLGAIIGTFINILGINL